MIERDTFDVCHIEEECIDISFYWSFNVRVQIEQIEDDDDGGEEEKVVIVSNPALTCVYVSLGEQKGWSACRSLDFRFLHFNAN